MKRRILSIITALALCLSLCPTWALAVEADPSLCKHHPEHTEDCGYIAPTEGLPCGHRHTAECYTLGVLPDADSGDPYEVGADTENLLDCHHSHNSECGYVQADPGQPCGYACRICPIEVLIAALPEQVTEDNADDVRGQLDHILDLYRELNENEQGQLDLSHVTALQETLDAANAPMAAAETINVTNATNVTLTAEDGGCQGHTFTGTAEWAMIYVESGAHDVTFSDLKITASAMVGVAPGATMNLTIEGTNMIRAGSNFAGIYVPADAALTIDGAGSLNVSGNGSAGIGGGAYNPIDPDGYTYGDPNCGTVEIKGGTVTATGGRMCAGIGGGSGADYSPGNGGTVTISGGTVTAAGGVDSSGKCGGAGIGGSAGESDGSYPGSGGTLTISGGHVTLTAGNSTSYGFGQATGKAPGGTCELTLTDASYLAEGTTLDPNGKYTITGDPTPDMIVVPEDLIYSGKAQELAGRIYIDDSKTGTGTYFGRTFTVNASAEGWVLQDLGEVVEAGEYTAVFKKDDKEISKTFTVAQSGTQFVGDGEVKTYNGDTLTTSFSAGDTITVKATPTPTGDAPQKAAARLRADPTKGQMVVYVGTTQVSVPADKGEDGSYTMTVSAADVLLAAGGPGTEITLTARFTANDNMADGTGTATVNITAAAKAERDGNVIDYFGVSDFEGTNNLFFQEAYADATITLLGDVQPGTNSNASTTCSTMVNITCSLDLTGHNFTSTDIAIYVLPGGNLTIQDSSTGKTGTVSSIKSDGTLQLYGGTFGKIETAYTLASLLAENCAYYKGSTPVPLSELEGKTELTGPVTVQACQHTAAEYTPNENDASTHTKTCLACGYTETGDCGFEKTADPTADSHTGQCPDCKRDRSGAHSFSDWAGNPVARTCTVCGYEQTAVARVEKDSTTTYVGALANAFTEGNSGATVTLLSEVDLGSNYSNYIGIRGSSTFTLNLNGQTVKASHYGAFDISGGSLTIQDSGTGGKIESSNITIKVTGGTLSIKSGTVSGFYGVQITSGTVNISGGVISGTENGLWVNGGGNIVLSGGAYSGIHAILVDANVSVTLKDLLATGYAYHQNDIPIANATGWLDSGNSGDVPLDTNPAWLTGTVTVKECNHTGGLVPSENGYQHGGPCKCCGTELTAANHTLGADNKCGGCGAELVAKVEKSGSDTVYVEASNLASAFAAENTGATVTLLKDVDLGENDLTLLSGTFTLDCGAFTLSSSSEYFVIKLDNADLTFAGGTIQCNGTGNAVLCAIGTFTMTGGTLNAASDYALNCAYSGEANIQGGTVGTQGKGLCIGNPDTVKLSGGTYATICIVSNYGAQKVPLSTILADGRAAYGPDGPITRDTVDAELTGPIIVKECEHDGVTVQDQGNGKHGLDCPYCGYHSEHTTALTATASGNNVTLNGGCGTEGCNYAAELGTVSFTFENLVYGNPDAKVSWIKGGPASLGVMLKIDNALNYVVQSEEATHSCSLTNPNAEAGTPVTAKPHTMKVSFYDNGSIIGTKTVECELTFTVAPAPLTPSITGTATKPYDGTTDAPAGLAITLTGVVGSDDVTATASYAYDTANAGTNKTITASGITLGGADAGNYQLSSTTATTTGTITKANVTLTAIPAANTLTYNGTAQALISAGTASVGEVVYSLTETGTYSTTIPTGTNAGSYEVWHKVEGNENYNGIAATKIDVTISRKAVTPSVTITPDSYEYTGQQIKPGEVANTTVTVKDGDTVIPASEYTLSYGENTHVGSGSVTVTDSGSGNYQITEKTQNFTITKKHQETLSISGKPETTAYGDTFTLTTSGGSGEGAVTWSVTGPATVSSTGEVKITGVGSVTVTANKAGGDDYEDAEATLTFEAAKKAVTAVVTAANKTYDGNTSATVTASVNDTDLVTGDSITITGVSGTFDNANAGTGKTVTVDGTGASISGNNADKYQVTFPASTTADIEKAIASVKTAPTAKTLTYTGEAQALVNAGTASVGEVVYSLTEAGTYSTAIPTGTNAGSYTVWYKIADTDNYTGTTPVKVDVTISKINYTGTIAASTSGKFGREKTYDLSDLLPEGYKLGTPTKTDANSIFEGTPTVSGTVLTYKLADNAGVGKIGTITIPVTESTNYNPFDLTITVTVTDKIVPTLTITPISVPYTGSAVPAGAIQGTATADGKNIPGSWSFADGQALTNVADSGTKTVNFTPADEVKDDYAPATGTVRVTITKATPSLSLTPSPTALPNGGTVTLTLSGLPSGGSATVSCSNGSITVIKGSGDTWTADLPAGGASYTFTASYSGDGNHNGATANCTVSVEKITPTLSLTANPTSLHGGGTVTLTLSGLPAGGTATVTCSGGITVTAGAGNTWTATLPNNTATYTFTASYAGNASYNAASASCTVEAIEVTVLPNPPAAEDGKQYQVVMEDGISEVPAGLQSIETLNTPEKLETAMKTAITQANSGVPQDNTAVYDVELQISDNGGATWTKATAANFPANGLTVTLPYPAGTNSSYTFTVVHMFTTSDFNKTPGDTETPRVTNTASGLQFTVTGLSPISVGWVQPSTPTTPTGPTGGGGGGGGSSVSTYAVTVEKSEHGKVTSNRTNASSGSTVTLTVTPDSGYVLDTLAVTDSRGNEIKLSAQGGGKYTFTMPSRAVTVKATFAPLPEDTEKPCDGGADCPSHGFTDLGTVGTWYHEAVDYVLRNNLMGGYGNGLFGPNDTLTRAQFAQILYNKEGRPAVTGGGIFTDVAPGAWCAPAVTWAAERGIVGGYGNGMFGPNDNITREQLAVMLWRYAGSPAATDKELHFTDADKASGYALDALRWAVENSIINGKGGGILDPKGLATRAQVAQMLKNFLKDE